MPIDDDLRITPPKKDPRLVKLLGGPLGMREHFVPPGAEGGYKIVVHRDGRGDRMVTPVIYELDATPHPKWGEFAKYAGVASDDDVRRWLEKGGEP